MLNLMRLKRVRNMMSKEALIMMVLGTVISHLDYANGILVDLPDCDIKTMQGVQNIAAKIILQGKSRDGATQCLIDLHWLPIKARIKFKVCVVFKALNGLAPIYVSNLLVTLPEKRENLRLLVPRTTNKTFAERSFAVYGPREWNNLPNYIKESSSIDILKKHLKTYLFREFLS